MLTEQSVFLPKQDSFSTDRIISITGAILFVPADAVSSFFRFHLCRARKLSFSFAVAPGPGLLHRDGNFGTEKNDTAFLTKKGTNKVAPVLETYFSQSHSAHIQQNARANLGQKRLTFGSLFSTSAYSKMRVLVVSQNCGPKVAQV